MHVHICACICTQLHNVSLEHFDSAFNLTAVPRLCYPQSALEGELSIAAGNCSMAISKIFDQLRLNSSMQSSKSWKF